MSMVEFLEIEELLTVSPDEQRKRRQEHDVEPAKHGRQPDRAQQDHEDRREAAQRRDDSADQPVF